MFAKPELITTRRRFFAGGGRGVLHRHRTVAGEPDAVRELSSGREQRVGANRLARSLGSMAGSGCLAFGNDLAFVRASLRFGWLRPSGGGGRFRLLAFGLAASFGFCLGLQQRVASDFAGRLASPDLPPRLARPASRQLLTFGAAQLPLGAIPAASGAASGSLAGCSGLPWQFLWIAPSCSLRPRLPSRALRLPRRRGDLR